MKTYLLALAIFTLGLTLDGCRTGVDSQTTSAPTASGSTNTATTGAPASGTPATGTPSTPPVTGVSAVQGQSISGWTACDGTSDDTAGVARAFAAARHAAFTLIVDCPVRIHIGSDISRPIFIDDGTTVVFTGAGKFTVDNVLLPAFVIADSKNVTLTDWNLEYDGGLPVNINVGGYEQNGRFVALPGSAQPADAFNDVRLPQWLSENRGITWDRSQGRVGAVWPGPTDMSAVFYVTGDSSNLCVTGMHVYVPDDAGGDRFVPMVFALTVDYLANQTVRANTPHTAQYVGVPHDLTFSNIVFDGTYMGWQGNLQNAVFEHIRSHRYGDLQDAKGGNVGGINKWFAPPHLFYLNYAIDGDPALFNKNIQISDVVDDGPRIGVARDKGGNDTGSGNALSLKIGCVNCRVANYTTTRPDGFLDVLPSDGLTITNVDATYDSAFLNNMYPGVRFPLTSHKNVTLQNISLKDSAPSTTYMPIAGSRQPTDAGIVFRNVQVGMNRWSGEGTPLPTYDGQRNNIVLNYDMLNNDSNIVSAQKGTLDISMQGSPSYIHAGQTTQISWSSKEANSCAASGAWTGSLGNSGSRSIKPAAAGKYDFTLTCQNGGDSAAATLSVVVQP